ncbi:MAG: RrF2 family transcriptional regulator [Treponemataceae bacterium]
MLLTRESDYALRVFRNLQDGELKTVKKICEQEYIPKQFAYKILKKLSKVDFIEILQGAYGGVKLKVDLSTINLYDLCCAVGDKVILNCCLTNGYECSWQKEKKALCVFQKKLKTINNDIINLLKQATILSIVKE